MKVVDRSVRKALSETYLPTNADMVDWADKVGEPYTSDELSQRSSRLRLPSGDELNKWHK